MLDRKTRVRLALAVVRHLDGLDIGSRRLVLRTFDLAPPVGFATLHDVVGDADDEQLLGLAENFDVAGLPELAPPVAAITPASISPLFIFGSHLSAHKAFVGEVGRELAAYGIDLFVAHDTITHDASWEDEIRAALDRADAGLVFVHDGLRDSNWCDQEIGWLQGRHVPVMGLRFDGTPYGFFARYQAQPVAQGTDARAIAEMTIDRIAAKSELAAGFAGSLVSSIATAFNFDEARARWRYLRDLSCLDAKLCAQLLHATKTNNQIYWANSPWDGDEGQEINRLVIAYLRRQPGSSTIASDVDAYEQYLDERSAGGVGFYTTHNPPPATVTV